MKYLALCLPVALMIGVSATTGSAQQSPSTVVDDAVLRDPPVGEWLTYGLDYAETRYSPLDQITTENVNRLGLAWTHDLIVGDGRIEGTPLVWGGVLYAPGAWNSVVALDAATGELKWFWDPAIVRGGREAGGPTISNGAPISTGENLVFMGWSDGRLAAQNATTGEPLWEADVESTPVAPITYEVDGRQYVSTMTGSRGGGAVPSRIWTFVLDGTAESPGPS